jgi:hypothetical protein
VDIRPKPVLALRQELGMDYRHIGELSNKGINIVILRNEEQGRTRIRSAIKRCQEFERELVIVYDDLEHLNKVKEIINEFKHRDNAV